MSGPGDRKREDDRHRGEQHEAGSRGNDVPLDQEVSDEAFDAYLQRGSTVSQHYRAIDDTQPPEQLDANILAHAQAALRRDSAHQYRRWKKWTVPAAVAASTVIAVSIVLESGMQHEVRDAASVSMMESESSGFSTELPRETVAAPAQPSRQAGTPSPAAPSIGVAKDEPTPVQSPEVNERAHERYLAFDAPAPPPQAKANADASSQTVTTSAAVEREVRRANDEEYAARAREQNAQRAQHELRSEQSAKRSAAPAARAVAPADDSRAAVDDIAATSDAVAASPPLAPDAWLEAIRDLRKAGNDAEADREWREFTVAYPSFEVATDDAARPEKAGD